MLTLQNITKTYANGVHALKGIDLTISTGMFGLLGPNGAGKSSLMRTIASLQQPDSGTIHFNHSDVFQYTRLHRQQLGYLPQDFGVYANMSAEQLLHHFAVLKGIHDSGQRQIQVQQLLRLTNLQQVKDKAVATYSGGMLRRFGIAQALLGDPQLLIVDEPTAGLDPQERNTFHLLLSKLAQTKVVILSTHIVEDISDLCDQVAVLVAGQIQAQGKPEKLMGLLAGGIWQKSIDIDQEAVLRQQYDVISSRLVRGQLMLRVLSDGKPEDGFTVTEATLEDVYFSVLHYASSNCLAGLYETPSKCVKERI